MTTENERTRPRSIIIENTVALNTGDAAIALSLIRMLRAAFGDHIQVTIFDSHSRAARHYYPELNFQQQVTKIGWLPFRARLLNKLACLWGGKRHWRLITGANAFAGGNRFLTQLLLSREELAALQCYQFADMVISTGGTYLVETYDLTSRIAEYEKDIALGKPPIFFTQSMGPFREPDNRRALKKILESSPLILVRDEQSKRNISDLGIRTDSVFVVADSAFLFAKSDLVNLEEKRNQQRSLNVAISVRYWHAYEGKDRISGNRDYRHAIASLTQMLVNDFRARVTFVSTCQGVPEYWTDDSKTAEEIVKLLPNPIRNKVHVDRAFRRPEHLVEFIGAFDFVVATRMHMAVLALCAGVPVLPIAYEFKTRELFARFGQRSWVSDISTVTTDSLPSLARQFISNIENIRWQQRVATAKERERALQAVDLLRDAFRRLDSTRSTHTKGPLRCSP